MTAIFLLRIFPSISFPMKFPVRMAPAAKMENKGINFPLPAYNVLGGVTMFAWLILLYQSLTGA